MKPNTKVIAAILAASVSSLALAPAVLAETGKVDAVEPVEEGVSAPVIALSEAGRTVATGLFIAKMALAQGEGEAAKGIIGEMSGLFGDADADLMIKTDAGFGLPVDAAIALAEGFAPTEAQAPAFAEANALMQLGDMAGVIRTLDTAGVDIVAEIAVLPYQTTIDGLNAVSAALDAGDFATATAALDDIGASIAVETFAPDALPAQGHAMDEILQG